MLKSNQLQKELDQKGFTKFQLFDNKEINAIKNFYESIKLKHNIEEGRLFHTTMNTNNHLLIDEVHNFLMPFFETKLKNHVENLNFTLAGFLVKGSGKNSAVTIHQDWNYVDESKFSSYSFWLTLEDTNIFNGCMQFVPGSHKFFPSLRVSPNIPDYFHHFKEKAANYLVDVPSKAGECVMFNQGIIHASRRNYSKKSRVACILGSYPKDADLLHYYLPKGASLSKVEKYRITPLSMIHMKKDERPPFSEFLGYEIQKPLNINFDDFKEKGLKNISKTTLLKTKFLNSFLGISA
jgi:hypothetical protein